ncbi:MAG: hypothetical protein O3A46_16725, partial [Candidatus Poribacteria bacterium]|nr:hypothetical protein [Candidatus Poribacteria bacterium]
TNGSWILAGGGFQYAPQTLQPRVEIRPNRIHRIGSGPVQFYPTGMKIQIYTMTGRYVDELEIDGKWDAKNARGETVSPGVYFYVAEDDNGFRETGRLVLR